MLNHIAQYTYQNEVSPERFAFMADWLLRWNKREGGAGFSLVLIDFTSPAELGNALGAKHAMELVRRVGLEIDQSLRSTDLLCRARASTFWVLLPKGAPDIVLQKLDPILYAARRDGLDATQLDIRTVIYPDELSECHSALELFERLQDHGRR